MLKPFITVILILLPLYGFADETTVALPTAPDRVTTGAEASSPSVDAIPEADDAIATAASTHTESDTATITVEWGPSPLNHPTRRAPLIASVSAPPSLHRSSLKTAAHPIMWKTDTEWISAGIGITTYGASANLTIATLRWPNMYWDTVRFFGGAWKRTVHLFGSSVVGMPFWASARHEFRVGTGITVGYQRFRQPIAADANGFSGSGITAAKVKTYLSLPLEAKYIYHYKRHLAFEVGMLIAFPMNYRTVFESPLSINPEDYDADYRPFVQLGAGMRF